MEDSATAPAPPAPPEPPAPHRRDVQRAALSDLSALARDCAAVEAELEERLDKALKKSDRDRAAALPDLAATFDQKRKQTAAAHDAAAGEVSAKQAEKKRALDEEYARVVSKIDKQYKSSAGAVKEKLQDAVWLAESVQEAAHQKADHAHAVLAETVREERERLDADEKSALEATLNYRGQWPDPAESTEAPGADPEADFAAARARVTTDVGKLRALFLPNLFLGFRPIIVVILLLAAAAAVAQYVTRPQDMTDPNWPAVGWAVGGTAVGLVVIGLLLRNLAGKQVRRQTAETRAALDDAQAALDRRLAQSAAARDAAHADATAARDREVKSLQAKFQPHQDEARRLYEQQRGQAKAAVQSNLKSLGQRRSQEQSAADEKRAAALAEVEAQRDEKLFAEHTRHETAVAEARAEYDAGRAALERRLSDGLEHSRLADADGPENTPPLDWSDPAWKSWTPPKTFAPVVRFGELTVDLKRIAQQAEPAPVGTVLDESENEGREVPPTAQTTLALPDAYAVPATLAFPAAASLLIGSDRAGREKAVGTLRMVMARMLTSLPPGRVQFKLIDPVGLGQSFAGFMHLADYDEALVGGRILTEQEPIERALADLTEHMETVIQKYLRNEFATIDDYNDQAGELAEPYRVLVIADLPVGLSPGALDRLSSIAASGPRCGVYTLISRDTRLPMPPGTHLDDLEANSATLTYADGKFRWKDPVFGQFALTVDPQPGEEELTRILHVVGKGAKEAKRIEVPFDIIAPQNGQFWSSDSALDVAVPVGRTGATRLQMLRLGRGVAQHALIAGKTGSGKSTLLNALVTNLAMWYPPDQLQFYLIDFKRGVEFKPYAQHKLPHARAVAVESDREFGLSVLQRLDAELGNRGDLYRKAGAQDVAGYRKARPGEPMPRVLLIIDEFQEFFSEDDRLAQESALLIDRLVRQGRAFGIHVLLGSQTIGGTGGLSRSTIGQMAVRVALQCSEADSQLILGDNNSAARLLTRPGEAIYNDQGGAVEANSPFQIAWLPDAQRERFLKKVDAEANKDGRTSTGPIVFEGNAPAKIEDNAPLRDLLNGGGTPAVPVGYVGEPVAIKEPTGVPFRRQSGANLLIIGQQEEQATAVVATSMLSIAAARSGGGPGAMKIYLLDGTPADAPTAGYLEKVSAALPVETKVVDYRSVEEALAELHAEMLDRQGGEVDADTPSIFLVVYGLQRYRVLRKKEDEFSFSSSGDEDEEKAVAPDKAFADLLREGPPLGIHVIAWSDTATALDRTLGRAEMREFDGRILFQMSAADSSNLIDSPLANKLGFFRAIYFSEEQGVLEKFRPYALPDAAFLSRVKAGLATASV